MAPEVQSQAYAHRTSDYSYRVPTPPRIIVPPPALNANALPEITLHALHSDNFLNSVNYNNLVTQNALLQWTYERRREAQMVLPYLFLGPMTAAKDEAFLRGEKGHGANGRGGGVGNGITMVLGVRQKHGFSSKLMTGTYKNAAALGIECHTVDIGTSQDLIHSFSQTTALINDHLARAHQATGQLGKVLVFCESGNERSAGILAAYLMETHVDVSHIKAMQLVQAQRFCANFDDEMKRLLQGYWDILCARKQVGAENGVASGFNGQPHGKNGIMSIPGNVKRGLERDDDEAMDWMEDDDVERFGGRTFAPFVDQPV